MILQHKMKDEKALGAPHQIGHQVAAICFPSQENVKSVCQTTETLGKYSLEPSYSHPEIRRVTHPPRDLVSTVFSC